VHALFRLLGRTAAAAIGVVIATATLAEQEARA
jgi:hypothetical protein